MQVTFLIIGLLLSVLIILFSAYYLNVPGNAFIPAGVSVIDIRWMYFSVIY